MDACGSLNHFYRSVCNPALGAMVALAGTPLFAQTNPTGGVAIQGQATFAITGKHLQVSTQNGAGLNHSAINWQSFSIPAGSSTWFQQPSATSTAINRVVTSTPSLIFGSLGSNGNLVLVNQSGITVGAGAVVDTAGFTASALRMGDADALSGRLRFGDAASSAGAVSVQGSVLARSGDVVLLGSTVGTAAQAVLQAPNGSTVLAAGQQIEITGRGLDGIVMQVQAPTDSAINLGTLSGDAVGIFAGTLQHSGQIQATQVSTEGGRVVLKAAGDAQVDGQARITASGADGKGGQVEVLGQRVAVMDDALLDASGANGGGTVLVGGDYQGKNVAVQNASVTYLGAQAGIKADATFSGDGGKVIVWSDDTTRAYGSISARGGAQGGNGGLVETSGHRYLDVGAIQVNASAPKGQNGQWLLDPTDITVTRTDGGVPLGTALNPYAYAPNNSSSIEDSTINASLLNGTDITLKTVAGTGNGDIAFDPGVAIDPGTSSLNSLNRRLSLQADRNILLQGTFSTSSGGYSGSLTVDLFAGQGGAGQILSPANLQLNGAGGSLVLAVHNGKTWTQSGNLTLQGTAAINLVDSSNAAGTFQNNGTVNVNGNGFLDVNGRYFSFFSNGNGLDNGVIRNDGIFNISATTAFEAEYNQTGLLNIRNVDLGLQNAHAISGTIDLAPAGATSTASLSLTEQHGNIAALSNLNILQTAAAVSNQTQVNVGTSLAAVDASFAMVNAPKTRLNVTGVGGTQLSTATIKDGDASFWGLSLSPTGRLALDNGHLGITGGSFTTPDSASVSYSGNVGYYAVGDLTVAYDISTTGNVKLIAGWNLDINGPATSLESPGSLFFGFNTLPNPVLTTPGNLDMEASGGAGIAATLGTMEVGGLTSAASRGGSVNLDNLANAMTSVSASAVGALRVNNLGDLNLMDLTANFISVTAGGMLSHSQGAIATIGSETSIRLLADRMRLSGGTIDAGGDSVQLAALSPGRAVDVGSGTDVNSAALELSNAELGTISAGQLRIGNVFGNTPSGPLNVSASIALDAGKIGTLLLQSDQTITQAAPLTVAVLNASAVNGITLNNVANRIGTFSASNTSSGDIVLVNSGPFSLGTLGNAPGGRWLIYADSPDVLTKNGLTSDFRYYGASWTNAAAVNTVAGNGFVYASTPSSAVNTVLSAGSLSHVYGDVPASPVLAYALPGIDEQDVNAAGLVWSFSPSSVTNAGSYPIAYVSGLSLSNTNAYQGAATAVPMQFAPLSAGTALTYTVAPRPVANWSGSYSNMWSDPRNWDVLPSGSNVQTVVFAQGASVTYDAAAGSTTLQSISGSDLFSLQGGALAVSGSFLTERFTQTGGMLLGSGSFTVRNAFNQSGGGIALTGPVNITQATGNLSVGSISASSISLQAASGSITQTAALVSNGQLRTASSGSTRLDNDGNAVSAFSATIGGPGDLILTNHAALDVQGIDVAAGNVALDNTGAVSISGAIHAPVGSVSLQAHSPITVNNIVDANGNILLAALSPDGSSNITLNGDMHSAAGGISVQAYNDFIQNSRLSAALAIDVRTLAGSLHFGPGAFSVGNPVSYSIHGLSYQPPWVAATLSGGANDFVVTFLDQFQAALDAQWVSSDDPLGRRQRGHEGVVVEGEQCNP